MAVTRHVHERRVKSLAAVTKIPSGHQLLELDDSGRVARNTLQAVPSAAQDTHRRETAQEPQQSVDNAL